VIFSGDISSIGSEAFSNCDSLTSIDLPDSVTEIGNRAFYHCLRLKSITIPPDVTSIKDSTFNLCHSLKSVTFKGNNISSIETQAFWSCDSLESIIIPDSVTYIGSFAFSDCYSLDSVSYLGTSDPGKTSSGVFDNCNKLRIICVSETYESSSFCRRDIVCRSRQCDAVNYCFSINGECIVRKKEEAIRWENESNGCVEYQCSNISGVFVKKVKCRNSENITICGDVTCVSQDKDWAVVIDIESEERVLMTPDEIRDELSNMTDIDISEMIIGIEYDDNGFIARIIVYVKDEDQAQIIKTEVTQRSEFC